MHSFLAKHNILRFLALARYACVYGILLSLFILIPTHTFAADIEAELDSNDGSSAFAVQPTGGASDVTTIDSSGNVMMRGCLRLDASGTECTDAENLVVDGNIAIGTASPDQLLHIENTSGISIMHLKASTAATIDVNAGNAADATVVLQEEDTNEFTVMHDASASQFQVRDGGADGTVLVSIADGVAANRILIDNTGNIGIGTDDPRGLVDIDGDTFISLGTATFSDAGSSLADLYVQGDLEVDGNVYLGDNITVDNITVRGVMTQEGQTVQEGAFSVTTDSAQALKVANAADSTTYFVVDTTNTAIEINNVTNVGINSANPSELLDIDGDVRIGQGTFDNDGADEDLYVTGNLEVDGNVWLGDAVTDSLIVTGAFTLTGSTAYEGPVSIDTTETEAFLIRVDGDGGDRFTVDTTNNYVEIAGANVGIGDTDPGSALVVGDDGLMGKADGVGDIYALGVVEADGGIYVDNIYPANDTTLNIDLGSDAGDDFSIDSTSLVVEGDTGRVGVGVATPSSNVHVRGASPAVRIDDSGSGDPSLIFSDDGALGFTVLLDESNSNALEIRSSGGDDRLTILDGGNIGIGDTTPTFALQVGSGTTTRSLDGTNDFYVADSAEIDGNLYVDGSVYLGDAITDTLTVIGTFTLTGDTTYQGPVLIDTTEAEAFLVRSDLDGGDIFTVDTNGGDVSIGVGTPDDLSGGSGDLLVAGSAEVDGNTYVDGYLYVDTALYGDGDGLYVGTGSPSRSAIDSGNDLYVAGDVEIDGDLYVDGSSFLGDDASVDNLTVLGDFSLTGNTNYEGPIIVDTTEAEALLIRSDLDGSDVFTVDTNGADVTVGGELYVDNTIYGNATLGLEFSADNIGDVPDMVITSAGNVGVGVTTPQGLLEVRSDQDTVSYVIVNNDNIGTNVSAEARLAIFDGSTELGNFRFSGAAAHTDDLLISNRVNDGDADIKFITRDGNSTSPLVIKGDGNIGLTDIAPTELLDVGSGASSETLGAQSAFITDDLEVDGNIYAESYLYVDTAIYGDSDGLFIGTGTPSRAGIDSSNDLYVAGDTEIDGDLYVDGSSYLGDDATADNLTVLGNFSLIGDTTYEGAVVIDTTEAEAFLVRSDLDGSDVFTVDTSGTDVTVGGEIYVDHSIYGSATRGLVLSGSNEASNDIAISAAGNVGMGTAFPQVKLDIIGSVNTTQRGTSDNNLTIIGGEGADASVQIRADDADNNADNWRILHEADDNTLRFSNFATGSWSDWVTMESTGNVGLNDITPTELLDVGSGASSESLGAESVYITHDLEVDGNVYIDYVLYLDGSVYGDAQGLFVGGGSPSRSAIDAANDLFVSGDTEIDGALYVDGSSYLGDDASVDNLTVLGDFNLTGNTNYEGPIIIDTTHAEALLVRSDLDGADIFTVDTSTTTVTVGGTLDVNDVLYVDDTIYGNASYGLRFSGNDQLSTDMVIDPSGNVGVGTTDISRGALVVRSAHTDLTSGNGQLALFSSDAFSADKGGRLMLGAAISAGDVDRTLVSISGLKENGISANRAGYMQFGTRGSSGDITERMRITSVGNVAVGAAYADYLVHVSGDIYTDDSIYVEDYIYGNTTTGQLSFVANAEGGSTADMVINSNGNVGIGVADPVTPVYISSTARDVQLTINSGGGEYDSAARFLQSATSGYAIGLDDSDDDKFKISYAASATPTLGTGDFLAIDTSGNVGIGDTSPTFLFQVGDGTTSRGLDGFYDAYVADDMEIDGDLYVDGSVYLGDAITDTLTVTGTFTLTGNTEYEGPVVIDTTEAEAFLVRSDLDGGDVFTVDTTSSTVTVGGTVQVNQALYVDDTIYGPANNGLRFSGSDQASVDVLINVDGNVGIGSVDPVAKLNISGGNIQLDNNQGIYSRQASGTSRPLLTWGSSDNIAIGDSTGTDDIRFNVAGIASAVTFQETSGNVGIGDSSPDYKLDVAGNIYTDASLYIDEYIYGDPENGELRFVANAEGGTASDMFINANGNVGIANTDPDHKLEVGNPSEAASQHIRINSGSNLDGMLEFSENDVLQGSIQYDTSADNLLIQNSASYTQSQFVLDSSGNVGIGDASPTFLFQVGDGTTSRGLDGFNDAYVADDMEIDGDLYVDGSVYLGDAVTDTLTVLGTFSLTGDTTYEGPVTIDTDHAEALLIRADGDASDFFTVDTISSLVTVGGSVQVNQAIYVDNAIYGHATNGLKFSGSDQASADVVIDTNGRLGVGVTNPSVPLQVGDGSASTFALVRGTTSNVYIGTSDSVRFGFDPGTAGLMMDGSLPLVVGAFSGQPLVFGTNNTEQMRIESGGNVGVGITATDYKVHVVGDIYTDDSLYVEDYIYGNTSTGTLSFVANAEGGTAADMVIDANGNVGIGDETPSVDLIVAKEDVGVATTIMASNTDNTNGDSDAALRAVVGGTSGGDPVALFSGNSLSAWGIGTDNSDSDKFKISNALALETNTRITIDTTGNVGVGDTSPTFLFQVGDGTTSRGLDGANDMYVADDVEIDGDLYVDGSVYLGDAVTDTLTVTGTFTLTGDTTYEGPVIIDTTEAEAFLVRSDLDSADVFTVDTTSYTATVGGTVQVNQALYVDDTIYGSASGGLRFSGSDQASADMVVDSTGNVGVGITTPSALFHVYKPASAFNDGVDEFTVFDGVYNFNFGYDARDEGSNYLSFFKNNSHAFMNSNGGDIYLQTAGTTRFVVDATNGNIGVGAETTPDYTLDVQGDIYADGSLYVDEYIYGDPESGIISFVANTEGGTAPDMVIDSNGNVGIGIASPANSLHVDGDAAIRFQDGSDSLSQIQGGTYGAGGSSKISFRTQEGGGALTTKLVIIDDGNVGVGIAAPDYLMHVSGDIYTDDSIYVEDYIYGNTSTGTLSFVANTVGGTAPDMVIMSDGDIGVGTDSPDTRFHVAQTSDTITGGLSVRDSDDVSSIFLWVDGSDNGNLDQGTSGSINLRTNTSNRLTILQDGNIGISDTTPTELLDLGPGSSSETLGAYSLYVTNDVEIDGIFYGDGSGLTNLSAGNSIQDTQGDTIIRTDTAGDGSANTITLTVGSTEAVRINSSTNVGVGITAADYKLHVSGDIYADDSIYVEDYIYGNTTTGMLSFVANAEGGTDADMVIDSAGNVGIGTTSTRRHLDVKGSSAGLILDTSADTGGTAGINVYADRASTGSDAFSLAVFNNGGSAITDMRVERGTLDTRGEFFINVSGTERFRIDENGLLGLTDADPTELLDVGAGASDKTLGAQSAYITHDLEVDDNIYADESIYVNDYIYGNTSTGTLNFVANTEGNEDADMVITSDGNVGIGSTNPNASLTLKRNQNDRTRLNVYNDTSGTIGAARVGVNASGGGGFIEALSAGYNTSGAFKADSFLVRADSNMSEGLVLAAGETSADITFYAGGSADSDFVGIMDESLNTGLGITAPEYKLHVSGDIYTDDSLYVEDYIYGNTTTGVLSFIANTEGNTRADMVIDANGNVGIDFQEPTAKLQVGDAAIGGTNPTAVFTDMTNGGEVVIRGLGPELFFDTSGGNSSKILLDSQAFDIYSGTSAVNGSSFVHLNTSGNMGLGDTSPTEQLDVGPGASSETLGGHSLYVTNDIEFDGFIYGDGSNLTGIGVAAGWTDSGSDLYVTTPTDNVAVGMTSPDYKFHVSGDIYTDDSLYVEDYIYGNTSTGLLSFMGSFEGGRDADMVIDPTGNVGIGVVSPTQALDISGSVRATGSYGAVGTSYYWNAASGNMNAAQYFGNVFNDSSSQRHLTFNTGGYSYFSGNLGVDDSVPTEMLDVGPGASSKTLGGASAFITNDLEVDGHVYVDDDIYVDNYIYGNTTTGEIRFVANTEGGTAADAVIDSDGYMGVGTTNPLARMHVYNGNLGDGDPEFIVYDGTYNFNFGWNARSQGSYRFSMYKTNHHIYMNNSSNGDFIFLTDDTQRLRIDAPTGYVGIGADDSPDYMLDVQGDIYTDASLYVDEYIYGDPETGEIRFVANTEGNADADMVIDSNGNVGIGELAPQGALHVDNSSVGGWSYFSTNSALDTPADESGPILGWNYSNGSGESLLLFNTDGGGGGAAERFSIAQWSGASITEHLTVDDGGNVGIGHINPGEFLHVGPGASDETLGGHSLYVSNDLEVDGIIYGNGAGITGVPSGGGWFDAGATMYTETLTDSVGVGVNNPLYKVHVSGDVYTDSSFYVDDYIYGNTTTGALAFVANAEGNTEPDLFIASSGNIGIGTFDPDTAYLEIRRSDSGVSELFAEFKVADAPNDHLHIRNATNNDSLYVPMIEGEVTSTSNRSALVFLAETSPGQDTGTTVLMDFISRQNDSTPATARPTFNFRNHSTSQLLIDANGNVGLSQVTPVYTLHVTGDIYTDDSLYVDDYIYGNVATGMLSFVANTEGNADADMVINSDGNVGIGSANPAAQLEFFKDQGAGYNGMYLRHFIDNAGGNQGYRGLFIDVSANSTSIVRPIQISTNLEGGASANYRAIHLEEPTIGGGSFESAYSIYQEGAAYPNYFQGNIGIGDTSPDYELHVAGDIYTEGAIYVDDYIYGSPVTGEILFVAGTEAASTYDLKINTDGNLGIGMNPNNYKLAVSGQLFTNDAVIVSGSYVASNSFRDTSGGTINLQDNGGNVGIGDATATELLDIGSGSSSESLGAQSLYVTNDIEFDGFIYGDGSQLTNITSSQWTTSGSDIYYDTGNVGVGATYADYTLHVQGDIYTDSSLYVDDYIYGNTSTGRIAFVANTVGGTAADVIINSDGNLGIGESSPGSTLHVYDDLNAATSDLNAWGSYQVLVRGGSSNLDTAGIAFTGSAQDNVGAAILHIDRGGNALGDLAFYTQQSTVASTDPVEAMRIDSTGNVGIGDDDPDYLLDVAGDIYADGSLYVDEYIYGDPESGIISFVANTEGGTAPDMVIMSDGNVGVGTTTPSSLLHIYSPLDTGIGPQTQLILENEANNTNEGLQILFNSSVGSTASIRSFHATNPSIAINAGAALTEVARFVDTGNVGIGETSPDYTLDVAGDIYADGSLYVDEYIYGDPENGELRFVANAQGGSAADMVIDSNGNVGIGSVSPETELVLFSSKIAEEPPLRIVSTSTGDPAIRFNLSGVSNWTIGMDNSDSDKFKINNGPALSSTPRLTIDANGNVGIGDASPTELLDVGSGASSETLGAESLYVTNDIEFDGFIYGDGSQLTNITSSQWTTSGSDIYYDTGNVGVGATYADYTLHVQGDIYTDSALYVDDYIYGNTSTGILNFVANTVGGTTPDMVIDSNGNVGIGVTATEADFHVSKAAGTDDVLMTVENTTNTAVDADSTIEVKVGGVTSTGDPGFVINIPSGQSWHMGADNSDSDIFKIGKGTSVGSDPMIKIDGTASGVNTLEIIELWNASYGPTVTDGAAAQVDFVNMEDQTINFAGTTQVTAISSAMNLGGLILNKATAGNVTIDEAAGLKARPPRPTNNAILTNGYGVYISDAGGAAGENNYGLYVASITNGTNDYAVFTAGSTQSAFGGNVGIGETTPDAALEIDGALYVDAGVNTSTPTNAGVSLSSSGDAMIGGDMEVDGALYVDNTVYMDRAMFNQEYNNGNSGAAATIDWDNGNRQMITLTDNATLTLSGPSGSGVANLLIRLVQDGTGSRTVTWATSSGSVKWPGGVAPTLTTTPTTGEDIVTCYRNGTDYYCTAALDFQ